MWSIFNILLIIKGSTLTDDNSISNEINNYFSTIDESIMKNIVRKPAILIIMTLTVTATNHIKIVSLLHLQIALN